MTHKRELILVRSRNLLVNDRSITPQKDLNVFEIQVGDNQNGDIKRSQFDKNNKLHVKAMFGQVWQGPSALSEKTSKAWIKKQLAQHVESIDVALTDALKHLYRQFGDEYEKIRDRKIPQGIKDAQLEKVSEKFKEEADELRKKAADQKVKMQLSLEADFARAMAQYYPLLNFIGKLAERDPKTRKNTILFVNSETQKRDLQKRLDLYETMRESGLITQFTLKLPAKDQHLHQQLADMRDLTSFKVLAMQRNLLHTIFQDTRKKYDEFCSKAARGELKDPEKTEDWYLTRLQGMKQQLDTMRQAILDQRREYSKTVMQREKKDSLGKVIQAASAARQLAGLIEFKMQASSRVSPGDFIVTSRGKNFGKRLEDCGIDFIVNAAGGGYRKREGALTEDANITMKPQVEGGKSKRLAGFVVYKIDKRTGMPSSQKPESIFVFIGGQPYRVYKDEIEVINRSGKGSFKDRSKKRDFEYYAYRADSKLMAKAKEYLETGTGRRRLAEHERREEHFDPITGKYEREPGSEIPAALQLERESKRKAQRNPGILREGAKELSEFTEELENVSDSKTGLKSAKTRRVPVFKSVWVTNEETGRRERRYIQNPELKGSSVGGLRGDYDKEEFPQDQPHSSERRAVAYAEHQRTKKDVEEETADIMKDIQGRSDAKSLSFVRQFRGMKLKAREKFLSSSEAIPELDGTREIREDRSRKQIEADVKRRQSAFNRLEARVDPTWKPISKEWYAMESEGAFFAYQRLADQIERLSPKQADEEAPKILATIERLLVRYTDEEIEDYGLLEVDIPKSQGLAEELRSELTAKLEFWRMEGDVTRAKSGAGIGEGEGPELLYESYLDQEFDAEDRKRVFEGEFAALREEERLAPGDYEQGQSTSKIQREFVQGASMGDASEYYYQPDNPSLEQGGVDEKLGLGGESNIPENVDPTPDKPKSDQGYSRPMTDSFDQ